MGKLMTVDRGNELIATALEPTPIAEILSKIRATTNPLSQDDIDRLRNYVGRLQQSQLLTTPEAQDFYRLSDIVTREYPTYEGSWLLFLVGGILVGMIAAQKT